MRAHVYALAGVCALALASTTSAQDLNDDFDDAKALKNWTVFKPGREDLHQKLDIGDSRKGWLTLVPKRNQGWYNEGVAPMLHKEIEGDFLIETSVVTRKSGAPDRAPTAHYNSAGLIVRDPASAGQRQNWVVVNVGRQDPDTGTEVKTTVNSRSVLELQRGGHSGQLRLGRIGATVYALRKLDNEDRWTLLREIERRDLPKRVQIGLMCNGWTEGSDLVAEFDYFRVSVPKGAADLTATAKK
jgi:hypothetical protein